MEYEIDEYGHCIIPEGIKVIEGMAFSGCRNLKSVKDTGQCHLHREQCI